MCCFHHSLRTSDTKKSKNIRVWRCDVAPTGRILENPLTAPSWPMHIISAQVFSVMRNYVSCALHKGLCETDKSVSCPQH